MRKLFFGGKRAAAGLALTGLALAAALPASAGTIGTAADDGTTTFAVSGAVGPNPLVDLWVVYTGTGGGTSKSGAKEIAAGPAFGTISTPITFDVPGYITSGYATVLSVYETVNLGFTSQLALSPAGVSVVVDSTKTAGDLGKEFSTDFSTTAGKTDEATIMSILQSGSVGSTDSSGNLLKFLTDNSSQFIHFTNATVGASGAILNFSAGKAGGTLNLSVTSTPAAVTGVPEPSAALLLLGGLGFIGIGRYRKNRS
jgi:hypothetical protein